MHTDIKRSSKSTGLGIVWDKLTFEWNKNIKYYAQKSAFNSQDLLLDAPIKYRGSIISRNGFAKHVTPTGDGLNWAGTGPPDGKNPFRAPGDGTGHNDNQCAKRKTDKNVIEHGKIVDIDDHEFDQHGSNTLTCIPLSSQLHFCQPCYERLCELADQINTVKSGKTAEIVQAEAASYIAGIETAGKMANMAIEGGVAIADAVVKADETGKKADELDKVYKIANGDDRKKAKEALLTLKVKKILTDAEKDELKKSGDKEEKMEDMFKKEELDKDFPAAKAKLRTALITSEDAEKKAKLAEAKAFEKQSTAVVKAVGGKLFSCASADPNDAGVTFRAGLCAKRNKALFGLFMKGASCAAGIATMVTTGGVVAAAPIKSCVSTLVNGAKMLIHSLKDAVAVLPSTPLFSNELEWSSQYVKEVSEKITRLQSKKKSQDAAAASSDTGGAASSDTGGAASSDACVGRAKAAKGDEVWCKCNNDKEVIDGVDGPARCVNEGGGRVDVCAWDLAAKVCVPSQEQDRHQDMIESEIAKKDSLLTQTLSQFNCVIDKLNRYVTHPNQRALQANPTQRTAGDLAAQQAQETEAGLVLVRIYLLMMCTWGSDAQSRKSCVPLYSNLPNSSPPPLPLPTP